MEKQKEIRGLRKELEDTREKLKRQEILRKKIDQMSFDELGKFGEQSIMGNKDMIEDLKQEEKLLLRKILKLKLK